MNNEFDIKTDYSRIKEINGFLNHIYTLQQDNPDIRITKEIIYSRLKMYNIGPKDLDDKKNPKSIDSLFPTWKEYYKNKKTKTKISLRNRKTFWFSNGKISKNEVIKLYLPIDFDHIMQSINLLVDFLEKENISYKMQIKSNISSNNVVIFLNRKDISALNEVLNFEPLKKTKSYNGYIAEGINRPNPFIPTINNVGIVYPASPTVNYNEEIAKAIEGYIAKAMSKNLKMLHAVGFAEYLSFTGNPEVIKTYKSAVTGHIGFNEMVIKKKLIENAINATAEKYGINQVKAALINAIDFNDYTYFSNKNENNYQNLLFENVSPKELLNYIKEFINLDNNELPTNEYVEAFINVYNNKLLLNTFVDNEIKQVFLVTYLNYDKGQLSNAIISYINGGQANGFSRYSNNSNINQREIIIKYTPDQLLNYIINYLSQHGYIYYKEMLKQKKEKQNLVNIFVEVFVNELHRTEDFPAKD